MTMTSYRFGEFTVDPSRARVLRGSAAIPLRPKSFALLLHLVSNADRLVTKDELLAAVWPDLVVTDDSLTRCISDVRAALGDSAQQIIKTVPRRGYVFAEPVTWIDAAVPPATETVPPSMPRPKPVARVDPGRSRIALRLSLPVLALVAAGAWIASSLQPSTEPARLSLVVLPFVELGDAPGRSYLADSVTEDLTVALSRLRGATVIASGTAFALKNAPVDLKAIRSGLKVRYAVQGSVLRTAGAVRITTRLVDTQTAQSLWNDQVDAGRGDMLATADEITARLASALDAELVRHEAGRLARVGPANLDAEDLALRCSAASMVRQGESGPPSFELCERALALDARNVRALVRLATYYGERVERMQSPDPKTDLSRARAWVDRALDADPGYYAAHCANATVLGAEHRVRAAIVAAERCRQLNPSDVRAYRTLATLHFFLAEPERTLDYVERGMRLSPRDPQTAAFLIFKGFACLMLKREGDALVWLRQADSVAPDTPSVMVPLISALALDGHEPEARAMLARYLALPRARMRTLAQWSHSPDDNLEFAKFVERFKGGLRKAGMPES